MSALSRAKNFIKHWNAFLNIPLDEQFKAYGGGVSYSSRPDKIRSFFSNERSIVAAIYARLAIDAADQPIRHVRTDDQERYVEDMVSGLNNCLRVEANIDQAATHFRQNIYSTMFERGVVAIVPVDTTSDPSITGSFDIQSMRVGEITSWMPKHVRVLLYNEETGRNEEVTVEKKYTAIVENPLYSVMNEPSSTFQRLIRKLGLLDAIDEQSGSGKLDLIIQLPYTIKSEARREAARQRTKEIEYQLKDNKYGIAYSDATEKVVQLNRPVENNLMGQIEFLLKTLYSQLGLTEAVMNGTADEAAMANYYTRTIGPLVNAVVESMKRTFLTKTARTQNQTIMSFRDMFRHVTLKDFAEFADVVSRNEIMSPNEIRQIVGIKPAKDPQADKLMNSNMPQKPGIAAPPQRRAIEAGPQPIRVPGSVGARPTSMN